MRTLEFANDLGLAHAGVAIDQKARHAIPRRIGKQRVQTCNCCSSLFKTNPAIGLDPGNALIVGQRGVATVAVVEMFVGPLPSHDHSSTGKIGTLLQSIGRSSSACGASAGAGDLFGVAAPSARLRFSTS